MLGGGTQLAGRPVTTVAAEGASAAREEEATVVTSPPQASGLWLMGLQSQAGPARATVTCVSTVPRGLSLCVDVKNTQSCFKGGKQPLAWPDRVSLCRKLGGDSTPAHFRGTQECP